MNTTATEMTTTRFGLLPDGCKFYQLTDGHPSGRALVKVPVFDGPDYVRQGHKHPRNAVVVNPRDGENLLWMFLDSSPVQVAARDYRQTFDDLPAGTKFRIVGRPKTTTLLKVQTMAGSSPNAVAVEEGHRLVYVAPEIFVVEAVE